jgi:hypothetical protein
MSLAVATDAVLAPETATAKRQRRKAKKGKAVKKGRKKASRPPKPKAVSKLTAANDRLHAIQVRNRERQEEARRLREWKERSGSPS